MKKSILHALDIFVVIYVIICPFIMQIRKSIIEYTSLVYFTFNASSKTKICLCVLSITLILLYGMLCGLNKSFKRLIIFLVACIMLKVCILIFDFIVPEISEFLWAVYCAPIAYIYQGLDVFGFVFYDMLFLIAFASGLFISRKTTKTNTANVSSIPNA